MRRKSLLIGFMMMLIMLISGIPGMENVSFAACTNRCTIGDHAGCTDYTSWQYSSDFHWKRCCCGQGGPYLSAGHTFSSNRCTVCGYSKGSSGSSGSDTTAPTATGLSLSAIYTNTGSIRATALGVTDDSSGVNRVQWYLRTPSAFIWSDQASTGQWYKDITVSEEGMYYVGMVLYDNKGNSNDTTWEGVSNSYIGWMTFYYDKTAPNHGYFVDSVGNSINGTTSYANIANGGTHRVYALGASDALSGVESMYLWVSSNNEASYNVLEYVKMIETTINGQRAWYYDVPITTEGNYIMIANVKDNAGNLRDNGARQYLVADRTAPTWSNFSPTGTIYTNNSNYSFTVSVNASDAYGIRQVYLNAWYGDYVSTFTEKTATYNSSTGKYEATYTLSEIKNSSSGATNNGDGVYHFDGRVYDNAGNNVWIGSYEIVLDTTPPTFSVSASKYYYNASDSKAIINVNNIVDTGGSGLSHLYYFYSELTAENTWTRGEIQNIGSSATIELPLNTEQGHEIAIKVVDKAGNVSYNSADVEGYVRANYVYDKTAPSATGLTLSTTYTNTGTLRATAEGVADNLSGVSAVKWYVRKSDWSTGILDQVSTGQWYYDVDVTSLGEGTYIVGMVIYDNAGNVIDTTSTIGWKTFYYDRTAPAPNGAGDYGITNNRDQTITLWAKATDNSSGIKNIVFNGWAGGPWTQYHTSKVGTYNESTGRWEATFTLSEIVHTVNNTTNNGEGLYIFDCYAYDNAGNSVYAGYMEWVCDTTAPTGGTYQDAKIRYINTESGGKFLVHVRGVTDNLSGVEGIYLWVSTNGGSSWNILETQKMNYWDSEGSAYYEVPVSVEGTYLIRAHAKDNAGNWNWGQAITSEGTIDETVIVDRTIPSVSGTVIPKRYSNGMFANTGTMLYQDPTFYNGMNSTSTYNNLGNGTVNVERIALADSPDGNYGLKITTTGEASPGYGGFFFANMTKSNGIYATRIVAKIPVGYNIQWGSNATGTGGSATWLTGQAGTGEYEEYICLVTCGATGTFGTTNFFYLSDGAMPTASSPLVWYVSYATVFDVTDNMMYKDPTFTSGNNSVGIYDNGGNNSVSINREVVNSAYGSYGLKIISTGNTWPGYGGFCYAHGVSAEKRYLTRIVAKIPVGYNIEWASNAIGNEGFNTWLTGQAGTGQWQEYICVTQCGKTGTFSSTNFFYIKDGTEPTASSPLTWYVAYATVIDMTNEQTARVAVWPEDTSGISNVYIYGWNGASWQTYHNTKTATYNSATGAYEAIFPINELVNTTSNTANIGDGIYGFSTDVLDKAGNYTNMGLGTILYDTYSPYVDSFSVTNSNGTLVGTFSVTDGYTGVDRAVFNSYGGNYEYYRNTNIVKGTGTFTNSIAMSSIVNGITNVATGNDGNYYMKAMAYDKAGNWSLTSTAGATDPNDIPTATGKSADIVTNNPIVTGEVYGVTASSGIASVEWTLRKADWTFLEGPIPSTSSNGTTYSKTIDLSKYGEGNYLLGAATITSNAGTNGDSTPSIGWINICYDTTAPTIGSYDPTQYTNTGNVRVHLYNVEDNLSGIKEVRWYLHNESADDTLVWGHELGSNDGTTYYKDITLPSEGRYRIDGVVYDNAGNEYNFAGNYMIVYYDATAPTIGSYDSTQYTNTGNVRVHLYNVEDNLSGIKEVRWYLHNESADDILVWGHELGSNDGTTYYKDITLPSEGRYRIDGVVYDNAGNEYNFAGNYMIVYYDGTAPTGVTLTTTTGSANSHTLTGKATDSVSGIVAYAFTTSASAPANADWTPITATTNEITQTKEVTTNSEYYFWVKDQTGNTTVSNKVTVSGIVGNVTSISISGANEVQIGNSIGLTAEVNGTAKSIVFTSMNTSVATVNSSTGAVTGVSVGTVVIKATATNYDGTTVEATHTVTVTKRTATLTATPNEIEFTYGVASSETISYSYTGDTGVTVTATSSNENVIKQVTDAETGETSWQVQGAGEATITYTAPETDTYTSASATTKVTVHKGTIKPTVTMSNYTYGGTMSSPSVSFEALVHGGEVTYYYNTIESNVDGRAWAEITTPTDLNAGTYYMYAVIAASDNYETVTTDPVAFTINKATPTLTVNPSSVSVFEGKYTTVEVTYVGDGYINNASSSDTAIATATLSSNTVIIAGVKAGNTTVTVESAAGTNYNVKSTTISVEVLPANYTDDTNLYVTLKDAFDNAATGSTIKVLKDVEDASEAVIASEKSFVLNTAGYTITKTNYSITNNGTLEVTGTGKIVTGEGSASSTTQLLADVVEIGDYVNYGVEYENVEDYDGNVSTLEGWRVIGIDGNTVNLVSAGVPLTYNYVLDSDDAGIISANQLTNDFINIEIVTEGERGFIKNGFDSSKSLKEIFKENEYTALNGDTPIVRAMKNEDIIKATEYVDIYELEYEDYLGDSKYNNLFVTGVDYRLASPYYDGSYDDTTGLWCVTGFGGVWYYNSGGEMGARPVVSLKSNVLATGQDSNGAWNLTLDESTTSEVSTLNDDIENNGVLQTTGDQLLADAVEIGDYVNYGVEYENVEDSSGYTSTLTGWRVIEISGDTVKLVSAGVPLTYCHSAEKNGGTVSAEQLTNNFLNITIDEAQAEYRTFWKSGFESTKTLEDIFGENKFTALNGTIPIVRSIKQEDIFGVTGLTAMDIGTSMDLANSKYNNLFVTGSYYWLASPNEDNTSRLWYVGSSGKTDYSAGELGVRPVVSLKSSVLTTGQDASGAWNLALTSEEDLTTSGTPIDTLITNNGTLTVSNSTLESDGVAINSTTSNLTIGTQGSGVNTTNPVIQGATYAIDSTSGFNFYDGILKGAEASATVPYTTADANITTESGYGIKLGTQTIDGTEYKTAILALHEAAGAPTITTVPADTSNWLNTNITFTLTASTTEPIGGQALQYKLGSTGTWTNYTGTVSVSTNGQTTIYARAVNASAPTDTSLMSAEVTRAVKIDKAAPTGVTLTTTTGAANSHTITGKGTDSVSGIVAYAFTTSASAPADADWTPITATTSEITQTKEVTTNSEYYFWVKDQAGNTTVSSKVTVNGIVGSVTSITISGANEVQIGNIIGLTTEINGTAESIVFTSMDTSVATVNSSTGVVTGVSAGTAVIKATATNYDGTTVEATHEVTVTKRTATITVTPSEIEFTYGVSSSETINYTYTGDSGVTVTATSSDESVYKVSIDSTTGELKGEAIGAGEATITINAPETDTYTSATATAKVIVHKGTIKPGIMMNSYTYGGTIPIPKIYNNYEDGTVTYYYNTSNSNVGGTPWTEVTSSTYLNANTYYMYAVIGETDNYNGATTDPFVFTISKATPTLTVNPSSVSIFEGKSTTVTVTYNGDGQVNSAVSDDTSIATATLASNIVAINGVKDGNTFVTVELAAGTNYNAKSTTISVEVLSANYKDDTNLYVTLKDAFDNAVSGSTITVLKDVEDASEAVVASEKSFVLNTNGFTITKTAYSITNNGTLEVTGTGKIVTGEGSGSGSTGETLLADAVEIGDYVNYEVEYENVMDSKGYVSTLNGWRVIGIVGDTVNLVSAGNPLTYYFIDGIEGGAYSANQLTNNFLDIEIIETGYNVFRNSGFDSNKILKDIFKENEFTALNGNTPIVRAMKNEDILKATGHTNMSAGTTMDLANEEYSNLFVIGAYYGLASAYGKLATTLWYVGNDGYVGGYNTAAYGIRPVVTLKSSVLTTGQDASGAWNLALGSEEDSTTSGTPIDTLITNNGTLTISNSTLESQGVAIDSTTANLTIGTQDSSVDTTLPVIQGATYAIDSATGFNFYDGILKGAEAAATTPYTTVSEDITTETGYGIKLVTQEIDGTTYNTAILAIYEQAEAPIITTTPVDVSNWLSASVTVSLTASTTEPMGGQTLQYKLGSSGSWTDYTGTVTVSTNGETTIYARAVNTSDPTNEDLMSSEVSTTIKIDSAAPTGVTLTTTTGEANSHTITGKGTDSVSGIVAYAFTTSAEAPTDADWTPITATTSEITQTKEVTTNSTYYFWVKDQAGNTSVSNVVTVEGIVGNVTTITISGANEVQIGNTIGLTAEVDGTPKSIVFTSMNTSVATVNSSTGAVTGVKAGTAVIKATATNYDGTTVEATHEVTVTKRTATITVTPSEIEFTYGVASTESISYTYTGDSNAIITGASNDETVIKEADDSTSSNIQWEIVGAGEAIITYTAQETDTYTSATTTVKVTVHKGTITPSVVMNGYTYGGIIHSPYVLGNVESEIITYYYNTENSNVGGTEWTADITSTTLDADTYYMYAVVGATDNYNEATTEAVAFTVSRANPTLTVNPSSVSIFEGKSTTVEVTYNGDGTLDATPDDSAIAEASVSSNIVTINGVKDGNTFVTVELAAGTNYNAKTEVIIVEVLPANYTDNTNLYVTLKDAFDNATSGSTIKVLRDVEDASEATVASAKSFVLDTNGHTITKTNYSIINNGTLEVKGTGTIELGAGSGSGASTQLLADAVEIGDYVNYGVEYENVEDDDGNTSELIGWRVISIDGNTVNLVSAGGPLSYCHGGSTSVVTDLTQNLLNMPIENSLDSICDIGFDNSKTLTQVFAENEFTALENGNPKVRSLKSEDILAIVGLNEMTTKTTMDLANEKYQSLFANGSTYWLASLYTGELNLGSGGPEFNRNACICYVGGNGWVGYNAGDEAPGTYNIRPVVSLKAATYTTGQDANNVWQITLDSAGPTFDTLIVNNGTLTVSGSTLKSSGVAIESTTANLTIGTQGNDVSTTLPVIQGATYAIDSESGFNFYDGILKGAPTEATAPYTTADANITKEAGYNVKLQTETIDSKDYVTAILAREITAANVSMDQTSFTYDGKAKEPTITVTWLGTPLTTAATLTQGTDYTVDFANNTNYGTATATVKGAGQYIGTVELTFNIDKASPTITASDASVKVGETVVVTYTYNGDGEHVSVISNASKIASVESVNGNDITIKGIATGTATITISASEGDNYLAKEHEFTVNVTDSNISITSNPSDLAVKHGTAVSFAVAASGTNLTYQWFKASSSTADGTAIDKATSATYSISAADVVAGLNGTYYYCVVSNSTGDVRSSSALLTVYYEPVITTQPEDKTVTAKQSATFSVNVTDGNPVPTNYQWQVSTNNGSTWTNITGATNASYTIDSATYTMNGYMYRVLVGNDRYVDSVTSDATQLTVNKIELTTPTIKGTYTYNKTLQTVELNNFDSNTMTVNNNTRTNAGSQTVVVVLNDKTNYQWAETNSTTDVQLTWTIEKATATLTAPDVSVKAGETVEVTYEYNGDSTTANATSNATDKATVESVNASTKKVIIKGVATGTATITITTGEGTNYKSATTTFDVTVTDSVISGVTNPSNVTVMHGREASFSVTANGTNLTYQWFKAASSTADGTAIDGATSATYSIEASDVVKGLNGTYYYCVVSNSTGNVRSGSALLTVYYEPEITSAPANQTVTAKETATFTVVATNGNPSATTYQWQLSTDNGSTWTNITGATSASYTTAATAYKMNGYKYRVLVGNSQYENAVESSAATLTVNKINISTANGITAEIVPTSVEYDGKEKEPTATVKYNTYTLKLNTDYTVEYDNNVEVGDETATATITGINDFEGTIVKRFSIVDTGKPTNPTIIAKLGNYDGATYVGGSITSQNIAIELISTDANGIEAYEWSTSIDSGFTSDNLVMIDGKARMRFETEMNQTIYFRAKDTTGNYSEVSSIILTIDKTAPSGSIDVNEVYNKEGVEYVNDNTVTFNVIGADNLTETSKLQIALINEDNFNMTNSNSAISWMDFEELKTWEASAGSGWKTVYIIVKDEAGNQTVYLAD